MRTRSLASIVLLIATLAMPLAFIPAQAAALQDDGTPADIPIEPENGDVSVEFGGDLGNGGQPDGFPREIVVDGERFQFDRTLAIHPTAAEELVTMHAPPRIVA